MGTLNVYFGGICVFFENYAQYVGSPANPPIRRMVLVDADVSEIVLGDIPITINPHLAWLTLTPPFFADGPLPPPVFGYPDSFDLNAGGVYTISFPAALPQPWVNSAGCLPQLQDVVNGPLGNPSLAVLNGGQAACYVDFTYGIIQGLTANDMGIAVATIPTSGSPSFTIQGQEGTATVTFESDSADVCITNKPASSDDDDPQDFLINFLTCANPPPLDDITLTPMLSCPVIPPSQLPTFLQTMLEAGPGCSNTNYP